MQYILHGIGYSASGVAAVESPSSRSQGAWGVEGVAAVSRGRSSWVASCGRVLWAHFTGGVGGLLDGAGRGDKPMPGCECQHCANDNDGVKGQANRISMAQLVAFHLAGGGDL